ncbi:MAG: hypothetical protein WCS99_13940 [Limisphaerales bacterium]
MSVEHLEQQVQALPLEERWRFAEWFEDHRHELLPDDTSPVQQAELLRRRQEYSDHPERFTRIETEAALNDYLGDVRREVRARVSSARPG